MKVRDFIKILQDIPEEYQDLEIHYEEDFGSEVTFTEVSLPHNMDHSTGLTEIGIKARVLIHSTRT